MTEARSPLAFQFRDLKQQRETSTLGMWTFLISEVMFFGSLLTAYAVYRLAYPAAFNVAGQKTDVALGTLNTAILLTSSLVMAFAVLAGKQGRPRRVAWRLVLTALLGLAFLGVKGYEYVKDWNEHLVPGPRFSLDTSSVRLGTGLDIADRNATPGLLRGNATQEGLLSSEIPGARSSTLDINANRINANRQVQIFFMLYFFMTGLHALHLTIGIGWSFTVAYLSWRDHFPTAQPVEVLGLYWHFVDIVWVFLYPLLYLVGRHS